MITAAIMYTLAIVVLAAAIAAAGQVMDTWWTSVADEVTRGLAR